MDGNQRPTGRVIPVQEPTKQSNDPPKKKRKVKPKVTPLVLLSSNGFPKLKDEMSKLKLNNKEGQELANLKLIMSRYENWATKLTPGIRFDEVIHQIEKISSGISTRNYLTNLIDGVSNEPNESSTNVEKDNDENEEYHPEIEDEESKNKIEEPIVDSMLQNQDDEPLSEEILRKQLETVRAVSVIS